MFVLFTWRVSFVASAFPTRQQRLVLSSFVARLKKSRCLHKTQTENKQWRTSFSDKRSKTKSLLPVRATVSVILVFCLFLVRTSEISLISQQNFMFFWFEHVVDLRERIIFEKTSQTFSFGYDLSVCHLSLFNMKLALSRVWGWCFCNSWVDSHETNTNREFSVFAFSTLESKIHQTVIRFNILPFFLGKYPWKSSVVTCPATYVMITTYFRNISSKYVKNNKGKSRKCKVKVQTLLNVYCQRLRQSQD